MSEDVYVINLKEREDKWKMMLEQFKKSKVINPIRFEGIKCKPGWRGCAYSHLNLIKNAKEKGLEYLIVFEDDTEIIRDDFDDKFQSLISYLKNNQEWGIFNGNPSNMIAFRNQPIKVMYDSPKIVSFERGQTTNFMIYSSRIYDKMLELYSLLEKKINNPSFIIDNYISKLSIRKLTIMPYLTKQMYSKSDVENRIVNYDKNILLMGEKFIESKIIN